MAKLHVRIAILGSLAALMNSAAHAQPGAPQSAPIRDAASRVASAKPGDGTGVQARVETILVFPFENSSPLAKLDWLSEGLSELTIERLGGGGQFAFPREERLATLEKLGLPTSTRFSRATMLKIAEESDADYVIFGQYATDGKRLTVSARAMRVSPPGLGPMVEESGALEDLMDIHARLAARVLCLGELAPVAGPAGAGLCAQREDRGRELAPKPPRRRLDAFEYYVRGLLNSEAEHDAKRLRLLREAARLEPAWDAPAFALGQAYFARRDCGSALHWFSRVPPAQERGREASFYAGVCHLLRNDAARAEAAFATLLEGGAPFRPGTAESLETRNNLGVARSRLGKSQEAAAEFERVVKLDPEEVDYWFNLGLARLRSGDASAAIAPFREVLRRHPDDAEARALLVAALERSGQASEAAAEREQSARAGGRPAGKAPLIPEALERLDRIKMRLDTASVRQFVEPSGPPAGESASPRRAQHSQLHLKRGQQLLVTGRLAEAAREFAEGVALAPHDPEARRGLAEVFRRQGRLDEAIRELRAALASCEDAAGHTLLARVYLEQGGLAAARAELGLALKLDPGSKDARELLEQIEARKGPGAKP